MENKDKYVYYDITSSEFREINEGYMKSEESIKEYFGSLSDGDFDGNGELIIYKLQPFFTIKKEITYKFKE